MSKFIFIIVFFIFFIFNMTQEFILKRRNIDTKGTPPINKIIFLIGKLSMFLIWVSAVVQAFGINIKMIKLPKIFDLISSLLFLLGFIIVAFSYFFLGDLNIMGLHTNDHELIETGLYRISRNPIYLGFFIMDIGSILYTSNIAVLSLGIFTIIVHHKIIISEENDLFKRFGNKFIEYKNRVRRYL